MLKIKFKEEFEKICARPILATFLVFLYATFLVVLFTMMKYGYKNFLHDVLVEAHGMLFDILVIGTFIFALQRIGEKRIERERNIQRHQDEIDDFRFWKSGEATHRIVGNIKRLNRNRITKIDLSGCYLEKAKLEEAQLQGAGLLVADLQGADLFAARPQIVSLSQANFQKAFHSGASIEVDNLDKEASLQGANLVGANLEGAKNLKVQQLSKVEKLYQAKLDPDLEKEIKEKYPHLLEKPWEEEE